MPVSTTATVTFAPVRHVPGVGRVDVRARPCRRPGRRCVRPHCCAERAVVRERGWRAACSWARRSRPRAASLSSRGRGVGLVGVDAHDRARRSSRSRRSIVAPASFDGLRSCLVGRGRREADDELARDLGIRRGRRRVRRSGAGGEPRTEQREHAAARQRSAASGGSATRRAAQGHAPSRSGSRRYARAVFKSGAALNRTMCPRRRRRRSSRSRARALLAGGERVLALLSGGADSVCLLHALREIAGPGARDALHVNHGLRAAADARRALLRGALRAARRRRCSSSGSRCRSGGNLEAPAREARYRAAERSRARAGLDLIATGHTATRPGRDDPVPARRSPGPPGAARHGARAAAASCARCWGHARARRAPTATRPGCPGVEDETNRRPVARPQPPAPRRPARAAARSIPAAEQNVLATAAQLRDEPEVLEQAVDEALARAGAGGHPARRSRSARLAGLPAALRRLLLRRLAEQAAGRPAAARPRTASPRARAPGAGGRHGSVDLGGGVTAVCEYGVVRFRAGPPRRRAGAGRAARCPGAAASGTGSFAPRRAARRGAPRRGPSTRRCWTRPARPHAHRPRAGAEGDRMQPAGAGGHEVAAGPVRRPQGAALAARARCRSSSPRARSPGSRASPSRRRFKVTERTTRDGAPARRGRSRSPASARAD